MYWKVKEGYVVMDTDGGVIDTFTTYDEAVAETGSFVSAEKRAAYVREIYLLVRGHEHGEWFDEAQDAEEEAQKLNYDIAKAEHEDRLEKEAMENFYQSKYENI